MPDFAITYNRTKETRTNNTRQCYKFATPCSTNAITGKIFFLIWMNKTTVYERTFTTHVTYVYYIFRHVIQSGTKQ